MVVLQGTTARPITSGIPASLKLSQHSGRDKPAQRVDDAEPTPFKKITTQIAPANGSDPGAIALGYWNVCGRELTLRHEDGREMTRALEPWEDAERAAREMLRGESGGRPIVFPDVGIA